MPLRNDIVLRPRFKLESPRYSEAVFSGLLIYCFWDLDIHQLVFRARSSITCKLNHFYGFCMVSLYFAGSFGKSTNTHKMRKINDFMYRVLDIEKSPN